MLYMAGLAFRYLGPYEIQWGFETVRDLLSIGVFAATTAFFIMNEGNGFCVCSYRGVQEMAI